MTLHLTHEMLTQAYELLRVTPPFKGWRLPSADQVEFHVVRMKGTDQADHCVLENGRYVIRVNYKKHSTLRSLIETMAHEMCHARQIQLKVRGDVAHGREFDKLADRVCKIHGFDRGQF